MNDMLAAQFERTIHALRDCAEEAESVGEFDLAGDLRFAADMLTDQHPKGAVMADIQVLDGNGDPVPDMTAPEGDVLHQWMAGRVPAAECPHYIAASEARAGFTKCEHCA